MRTKNVLAAIFCIVSFHAFSEETLHVLQGKVRSDVPVVDANVGIQETGESTITDNEGVFSLETAAREECTLIVTAIGYSPYVKRITLPFSGVMEIVLEKETVEMEPIRVEAPREKAPAPAKGAGTVSREEIRTTPTAGDPFAVIDQDPGIIFEDQLTDEGYARSGLTLSLTNAQRSYSVYGSDSDFNAYYYDYIRIPFNRHAEVDVPIIPVEAVGSMEIYKGIAPLELGPGIGGLFRAVPDTDFKNDSTLLISPGTEQFGAVWKKKSAPQSGLLLTATKSITEISSPAMIWGMKALYDQMGFHLFSGDQLAIPSYADLLSRFFTAFDSQKLTLDFLGYYDFTDMGIDMLGDYDASSLTFSCFAAAGFHWTAPPAPSFLNDASTYASLFRRAGTTDINMNLESYITTFAEMNGLDPAEVMAEMGQSTVFNAKVHEEPVMNIVSFEGKDSLTFFPTDALSVTVGMSGRYSVLDASYEAATDIDMQLYGFSLREKYAIPRIDLEENIAKLHWFASADARIQGLELHAGGAYTWFPLHGFSTPSVEGVLSWDDAMGTRASIRAGWSAGSYDEYAYLERRLNEKILKLPRESSYSNLPSSMSATGKLEISTGDSSRITFEPYFSWYYGLSGLAMYASYLDPYRPGAESRDLIALMEMLDPDMGFSTGAGFTWGLHAGNTRLEVSYIPSLTMYHRREETGDPWFYPNTDVRHTVKAGCSYTFDNKDLLSTSLNLFMDKPFTPEVVTDPVSGTLQKEGFNSARDLVPRFALGIKWESDSKFFDLPGRYYIDCRNLFAVLNPELIGMKAESRSVPGASTMDFDNREYRFFRTDLMDTLMNMELRIGGTYSF
jgi:hypothetical protein